MKEFALIIAAFTYHTDGQVTAEPQQTIVYTDMATCKAARDGLLNANWNNPFPIPEGVKPEDYTFTRWRTSECAARKAEKPAEEKPAEGKP